MPIVSAADASVALPLLAASVSSACSARVRPFGSLFSAFAAASGMNGFEYFGTVGETQPVKPKPHWLPQNWGEMPQP